MFTKLGLRRYRHSSIRTLVCFQRVSVTFRRDSSPSPVWRERVSSSPWLWTAWTSCWTGVWAQWWCWDWETTWVRGGGIERERDVSGEIKCFVLTERRPSVAVMNSFNYGCLKSRFRALQPFFFEMNSFSILANPLKTSNYSPASLMRWRWIKWNVMHIWSKTWKSSLYDQWWYHLFTVCVHTVKCFTWT